MGPATSVPAGLWGEIDEMGAKPRIVGYIIREGQLEEVPCRWKGHGNVTCSHVCQHVTNQYSFHVLDGGQR